ncbi:MAG TPA: twin-arginine translocation signal domain-containing protein, partial [Longimicrobiaceae bacterium]
MSSNTPNDERPRDAARPVDSSRREFLGRSAAMAAAVVGAPALLAACDGDSATGPAEARASAPEGASRAVQGGADPWWVLHGKIAATVGSASDVRVPALEQVTGGYLQRVITDNDRVGTGLATILRSSHKFSTAQGTVGVTVSVQTSYGKRYYARTL